MLFLDRHDLLASAEPSDDLGEIARQRARPAERIYAIRKRGRDQLGKAADLFDPDVVRGLDAREGSGGSGLARVLVVGSSSRSG
ncbi:MAG: hypothetical protein M3Y80_08145 [Verrucomicrobiota bacterium]|nr:hypothetical protein [Verrucomicrobiota bacterium]